MMRCKGYRGVAVAVLALAAVWPARGHAEPPEAHPNKCLMVIGAHADDVEECLAGGTMTKFQRDGYQLVYVLTINNAAGCLLNRADPFSPGVFTEEPAGHDYPADALETIEVRTKETVDAAAILGVNPIFLNFWEPEFWPAKREVVYIGDDFFQQYDPPGRNVVSVASRAGDVVDMMAALLEKYRPEIVITHMAGGEKHDHGNTGYLVYLAFQQAMEHGAVGQLWMPPYGWVDESPWRERLAPYLVTIDVTEYMPRAYRALDAHVSQMAGMYAIEPGKKYVQRYLVILDATKPAPATP